MPDDENASLGGDSPRGSGGRVAARVAVAQRRAQALELRIAGASLYQIAEALNYSRAKDGSVRTGPVATDIKRAIGAITAANVEELREIENRRLDELQRAHWMAAIYDGTDGDRRDRAIEEAKLVVKIAEVRCRINGINAPKKVDLTAWIRDFAQREGLPLDFAMNAAADIVAKAEF